MGISSVCPPVCSVIPDDIYEWGFIYEAIGNLTLSLTDSLRMLTYCMMSYSI